jgi:hypothetical protein
MLLVTETVGRSGLRERCDGFAGWMCCVDARCELQLVDFWFRVLLEYVGIIAFLSGVRTLVMYQTWLDAIVGFLVREHLWHICRVIPITGKPSA